MQSVISIWPRNGNEVYSPAPDSCSRHGGHQFGHPQQIVRHPYKPGRQLRLLDPLNRVLRNPPTTFTQPKISSTFFRNLWLRLYPICRVVRPSIAEPPRRPDILSHMRCDLPTTQFADKPSLVVPLIAPKGLGPNSLPRLPLEHRLGSLGLRRPRRRRHPQIHQKPIAVLHQRMRPIGKLAASLPLAFRINRLSGSVVDWCVSLLRFSPRKSTVGLLGSPSVGRSEGFSLWVQNSQAGPGLYQGAIHRKVVLAH